jgi:hypothetical protein
MTDDKITRLPTGYEPEPDHTSDLTWSLTLLHDEITQLSKTIQALTKGLVVMNNKIADIQRQLRKP